MLARPPKNATLAAIDRAVASLPPYPVFGPLPDKITGQYHAAPCDMPRARFGEAGVGNACICGFEIGEHKRESE
jgi:hypothetical protein